MNIGNWGNYPRIDAKIKGFRTTRDLREDLQKFENLISRGMGRCYGDSSLWQRIVSTLKFNRILAFDEGQGIMRCEAGTTLEEVLDIAVPCGWFLPVTPGTKHVTLGGVIASDAHGKNHHKEGALSDHVLSIEVMLSNGDIVACSRRERRDLFTVVCGGMGLIGVVLNATFRLKRIETAYIKQTTVKAANLDEVMDLFDQYARVTYSVAWIDCLANGKRSGRSIFMMGEHAGTEDLKGLNVPKNPLEMKNKTRLNVPFQFPSFILNRSSANAFNRLYYLKSSRAAGYSVVDYNTFFYPLDAIHHWNRIYGSRGFIQYQCVLPMDVSKKALKIILDKISNSGEGPFLAVLKLFGKGNDNLLSFPMEGYTLALDFPLTRTLFHFLNELDKVVLEHAGRLYLAKDARMTGDMFRRSYGNAKRFIRLKHQIDEANKFKSLQSQRLEI
jgi:decaprenylphospho-beta-D-ribofuranose 2-oxidase